MMTAEPQFFGCPLCGRYFRGAMGRRMHWINSKKCDIAQEVERLRVLLADREEALTVARRQRDEARETEWSTIRAGLAALNEPPPEAV